VTPRDLLDLRAADAVVDDPEAVASWLAALAERPGPERLAAREERWSSPLPGSCDPIVM
jgi:hypothetical protein